MPLAKDFNDVMAMDLKEWDKRNNVWLLHMIDLATRFCVSAVIHKKEKQVIIDNVIEKWIGTGLGCPKKILTDNRGEFANDEFRDMCENLNITVMTTAAESPFSNGICERNHAVIDEMVHKILTDQPNIRLSTAVAWAVHAKNTLQMVGGYSPYQLVFGCNPQLPSVCCDDPPALEGTTTSEMFAKHLNALHNGRQAFLKAETSERIRRALRHQIRPIEKQYKTGDSVFYKRDNCNEWKGPGTVIGQDGKVVLIRHGSNCMRVHSSRVLAKSYKICKNDSEREESTDADHVENVVPEDEVGEHGVTNTKETDENVTQLNDAVKRSTKLPKIGQTIEYIPVGESNWKVTTILGRAGKATGKYKYWLNIHDENEDPKSIDWSNGVEDWREREGHISKAEESESEESEEVYLANDLHDSKRVREAKFNELQNWKRYNVYEEVCDNGQPCISVRWVCTEKHIDGKPSIVKARLVGRGFQEVKDDHFRSDSPTAGKECVEDFSGFTCSKRMEM